LGKAFIQAAIITGRQDSMRAVESYPILFKISVRMKHGDKIGMYLHNCSN
jgi:hypothetical protein